MKKLTALFFLIGLLLAETAAQPSHSFDPSGYWVGSIMKEGAAFRIELSIEETNHVYSALTRYPDWIYYLPEERDPIEITENGLLIKNLLYDDATLQLVPKFEQLFGLILAHQQLSSNQKDY